jgi:hypothetical protein
MIDAIIFSFLFMLVGIGFLVVAFATFCLILYYLERR